MGRSQTGGGEAGSDSGENPGSGPAAHREVASSIAGDSGGGHDTRRDVSVQKRVALILSTVVLGVAIAYLIGAFNLAWGTIGRPGVGFFPRIVAVGLIVIAVIDLVLTARRPSVLDAEGAANEEQQFGETAWRVPVFIGLLVAYFVTLPLLGHLVAAAVMCTVVVRLLSGWRWWTSVAAGIGVAVGSVIVFDTLLGMRLPG